MIPEPLDEFDRITSGVPVLSPWQAVWNQAEEILRQVCPEGFTPEDIGRAALDLLPEPEKAAALDALFYTYWSATMADRETRAAREQQDAADIRAIVEGGAA
ncbi:hypothetical protein ACFCWG_24635 [Streptomyces sp. NPDC056390]|uniref:hypothetical protein n=1 Tax=Streptomyces sp. NPDC056390 TaxID=3345806 RepID=UPI0035D94546